MSKLGIMVNCGEIFRTVLILVRDNLLRISCVLHLKWELGLLVLVQWAVPVAWGNPTFHTVEYHFRVVGERAYRGISYGYESEAGYEYFPVRFRSQGRSVYYCYKGPPMLAFYRQQGNGEWEKVADVEFSQVSGEPLLLLFTENEQRMGADDYVIHVLPDGEKSQPPEHLTIYNTMGISFHAMLRREGEKVVSDSWHIVPGMNKPIPLNGVADLKVGLYLKEGLFHELLEERLSMTKNERILLILFPPSIKGGMNIRGMLIRDYSLLDQ